MPTPKIDAESDLAADLLNGCAAIASFIGETERRTSYLLENRLLPAGKVGQRWGGSRNVLREHYARLTRGEAA